MAWSRRPPTLIALMLLPGFVSLGFGQTTPQLGSSDFKATSEHPIGWRGGIYIVGDTGTTVVLQPGRSYKTLATNVLEEKPLGGFNFLSSPWFEGKCMYYRSGNYLYCIQEK